MFAKPRTWRFMQARGSDSAAVMEFAGKVQCMARVHLYRLKGWPNRNSAFINYPERKLLAFIEHEMNLVVNKTI